MDKLSYFIEASQEEKYRDAKWVIRAFSITKPIDIELLKDTPGHMDLFFTKNGYFFYDSNQSNYVQIDHLDLESPLYKINEQIEIDLAHFRFKPEEVIKTSYGRLLANLILILFPFKGKIEYQNKRFTADSIESLMPTLMIDNPEDGNYKEDKIYVKDYLAFTQSAMYLQNFTQLFIPGDTEKSLVTDPKMEEFKYKLANSPKYKGRLSDPATLSEFEKELEDLDRKWLEGDESTGLYKSDKSMKVVRKRLHRTFGHEQGFSDSVEANTILPSLAEGWDLKRFSDYADVLRAGSYDRGAQTAKGGELVKWLVRASGTVNILPGDCGSTLGVRTLITESNYKRYIGFSYVNNSNTATKITNENVKSLIGKRIIIRSFMYCNYKGTNRCSVCAGERLANNPTGASSSVTAMGDIIMYSFMLSMHGTALQTATYDPWKIYY